MATNNLYEWTNGTNKHNLYFVIWTNVIMKYIYREIIIILFLIPCTYLPYNIIIHRSPSLNKLSLVIFSDRWIYFWISTLSFLNKVWRFISITSLIDGISYIACCDYKSYIFSNYIGSGNNDLLFFQKLKMKNAGGITHMLLIGY